MKLNKKIDTIIIIIILLCTLFFLPDKIFSQVVQQDSLALVAFYDSTNGDSWSNNTNWKSGPVSTWHGITLSGNRVTQIILNYNSLSGKLPAEIGNLTSLNVFLITNNAIGDTLPTEIGNLASATWINFSHNNFGGNLPATIGNLTNLEKLYLDHNSFTGDIPIEIGNLSSLLELELSRNQFDGNIPAEIGNLANLNALFLNNNLLTGSIPQELGRITAMQYLNLSNNQLSGNIPDSLGNFTNVATFNLSANQLTGAIPPALGNVSSIAELVLHDNQLSGSIPPELGNIAIQSLTLNDNQLTGSIPYQIGNITNLTGLYLQNNQISGSIPSNFFNLSNLAYLDLSNNQITDTISAEFTNLSGLNRLYLNNNNFYGSIPVEFGLPTNLQRLWLNDNQLGDSIPVELSNNNRYTQLYLHNNNFIHLPDMTDGNMHHSVEFRVENNYLDFDDIEPNSDLSGNFIYAPQAQIGTTVDTTLFAGDSMVLHLNAGGTVSEYHWFKDSVEFLVSSDTMVTLYDLQIDSDAEYYCEVTNSEATNLTLYSFPINITIIDTTAPQAPVNLVGMPGDSSAALSWEKVNASDSIYYRIYMDKSPMPITLVDSTNSNNDTTITIYGLLNDTTYYVRVTAIDFSKNESGFSNEISITPMPSSLYETDQLMPKVFALEQNYPNPFNPVTKIVYALPKSTEINISIYNMLGQHIITLLKGKQSKGFKEITWNGLNKSGERVNSGVYIYTLSSPEFTQSKKLILLK